MYVRYEVQISTTTKKTFDISLSIHIYPQLIYFKEFTFLKEKKL